MTTLNANFDRKSIHREWATRPDDQRFLDMQSLHAFNCAKRDGSLELAVDLSKQELIDTPMGVALQDPDKKQPVRLNNWSFGQLCTRAKAPAAYLRTLPAELAIQPLRHSLRQNGTGDSKLLVRREGKGWMAARVSSPTYGYIPDAAVSCAILENVDLSVWKVPSASYASHDPKRATTLYASDRDCFIALVDDAHPIEIGEEKLFRGFIARNSEVGLCKFDFIAFLYRYICDNRQIWGGGELFNFSIRHTSGGPGRYIAEAKPMLEKFLQSSTKGVVSQVQKARLLEVGKTDADTLEWITGKGFTDTQAERAYAVASAEPGLNPRSLYGVVQGLTGIAHEIEHGDIRLDFERKAGALMALAAT